MPVLGFVNFTDMLTAEDRATLIAVISGDQATFTNKILDDITNYIGANHLHYPVRNDSGAIIPAGTVVTAATTQPGTDYLAINPVTDPQTQIAVGITHMELANNGTGLCINTGIMKEHVDTSAWPEGTILYPNSAGGLTEVKPTSGQYQACAIVTRSHATQGTLLVEFTEPKKIASTTQAGYVQLINLLTSTDVTKALTAAQGKVLKDLVDKLNLINNSGTLLRYDKRLASLNIIATVFDANDNLTDIRYTGDDDATVYYRDVFSYDAGGNLVTIKHFYNTADLVTQSGTTTLTYTAAGFSTVSYSEA